MKTISTDDLPDSWLDLLDAVPPAWYERLTLAPSTLPVEEWPFPAAALHSLHADSALRTAIATHLDAAADLHWSILPDAEETDAWLHGPPDEELEETLRSSARGRDLTRRHAWLAAGFNLLSADRAEDKLGTIHALPPLRQMLWHVRTLAARVKESTSAVADTVRETLTCGGTALAAALAGPALVPACRGDAPEPEDDPMAGILARMGTGEGISLSDDTGWLRIRPDAASGAVIIKAGRSSMNLHPAFTLEFRRAGSVVFTVAGQDGIARVTTAEFHSAAEARVDEIALVTPNPGPA